LTNSCTGTEENTQDKSVIRKIGLNSYQISTQEPVQINVFSINGTLALSKTLDANNSEIDLNSFVEGMYIININSSTVNQSERVFVE
jgi:hypothetical protein